MLAPRGLKPAAPLGHWEWSFLAARTFIETGKRSVADRCIGNEQTCLEPFGTSGTFDIAFFSKKKQMTTWHHWLVFKTATKMTAAKPLDGQAQPMDPQ